MGQCFQQCEGGETALRTGKTDQLSAEGDRLIRMKKAHLRQDCFKSVIRSVDRETLALALKTADEKLKEKILRNVSQEPPGWLQALIDGLGAARLSQVEAAQRTIAATVRERQEIDKLVIRTRP